ncbi:putative oxidoreductase [Aspergillus costaricaensis CBS 115574]|uniref:Oxidoreductase n=1 Tax=Aspergillus costaricaensis CBS 115574 TaxID=1448317 RepID=A0ACD1IDY6_9EURO|nr:putative oxidoreductase [Aspergillus costaricaensis CBS 115574]RAK88494.1 putative oxidoreductase [Aspergillus costaricaensis CBS 115574]
MANHAAEGRKPSFVSIPIIDYSLALSPTTKTLFLAQLKEALVMVGFFYLKNPPIAADVKEAFVEKAIQLCNLPLEKKLEIDMVNSRHFLGYSRLGAEKTAQQMDHRELFHFLTPLPAASPDEPVWRNAQGPNQWPDETAVPGFRESLEQYLDSVSTLADAMKILVAEALDLHPNAFFKFFDVPPRNKMSIVKYPSPPVASATNNNNTFQGVGSHKDGGFLTYLLQATLHAGLEAQNKAGDWVPVPPVPNTLVMNVGRSLEYMTSRVCTATTHRVNLRPECFTDSNGRFLGPRFSIPVFQTFRLDLAHDDMLLELPGHILDLVKDQQVKSDAEAFFSQYHKENPGYGIFKALLASHPDVGQRWYPDLLAEVLKAQREFSA